MSRAEQMAKMKADKEAKEKANKRRDRTQIIFEVKGWEAGQDMDEVLFYLEDPFIIDWNSDLFNDEVPLPKEYGVQEAKRLWRC